jgi:hypothetical protein
LNHSASPLKLKEKVSILSLFVFREALAALKLSYTSNNPYHSKRKPSRKPRKGN